MHNPFYSKLFVITAIIFLFALLFSQRGLSALAANPIQDGSPTATMTVSVTATVTKTLTPSPSPTLDPAMTCANIEAGYFVVTGGDDLNFYVYNDNLYPVVLTNTTLHWTDYYDPNMVIDYFDLSSNTYWPGNGWDSPTTVSSNVIIPSSTSQIWNLDFDGFGNLYGQTHTIGPFTVELTFDGNCVKTATIHEVIAQVTNPVEHQRVSALIETDFEAIAWDTGVGSSNGSGIDRVHIVILDPLGNVIVNRNDSSAPYCAWGNQSPCPRMPQTMWNSLSDGIYQMIVWGRSGPTQSWSEPHSVYFKLLRDIPWRPTETPTP